MLLFVCLIQAAWAGDLLWNWALDKPVRYHIESVLETPRSHRWIGGNNVEARATKQAFEMDLSCTGKADRKRWAVSCTIDNIQIHGRAVGDMQAQLEQVFEDSEVLLTGKELRLNIANDGRVKKVDLHGVEKFDDRSGQMLENLRLVLRRVLSPVDLQLPSKGEDKGKRWRQKGSPLALELLTATGTAGGVAMKHWVVSRSEDGIRIDTEGRGSMTEGASLEGGVASIRRVNTKARALFDATSGQLWWREYLTEAGYTASTVNTIPGGKAYTQSGWIGRYDGEGVLRRPTAITSP